MKKVEKKTYFLVGICSFGAILIFIAFLFTLKNGFNKSGEKIELVFKGSVKGLAIGSIVSYQGVEVGSVNKINIIKNQQTNELIIPVVIEINNDFFVAIDNENQQHIESKVFQNLKARIVPHNFLTGRQMIELKNLTKTLGFVYNTGNKFPQIPTLPSPISVAGDALNETFNKLENIDFAQIAIKLSNILNNLENFSNTNFLQTTQKLDKSLDIINNELPIILKNSKSSSESFAKSAQEFPELVNQAQLVLVNLNKTIESVDSLASPTGQINTNINILLKDAQSAMENLDNFLKTINRNPNTLLYGR